MNKMLFAVRRLGARWIGNSRNDAARTCSCVYARARRVRSSRKKGGGQMDVR